MKWNFIQVQVLVESRGITQVHLENNINVKCKDARHAMSNFRLHVKNTSDNIMHDFEVNCQSNFLRSIRSTICFFLLLVNVFCGAWCFLWMTWLYVNEFKIFEHEKCHVEWSEMILSARPIKILTFVYAKTHMACVCPPLCICTNPIHQTTWITRIAGCRKLFN